MFLAIIGLILPPLSILLLGMLLILVPQHHAIKQHRALQRLIRLGNSVRTTTGLVGIIFSVTQTHVIIVCNDGTKHEVLRASVVAINACHP